MAIEAEVDISIIIDGNLLIDGFKVFIQIIIATSGDGPSLCGIPGLPLPRARDGSRAIGAVVLMFRLSVGNLKNQIAVWLTIRVDIQVSVRLNIRINTRIDAGITYGIRICSLDIVQLVILAAICQRRKWQQANDHHQRQQNCQKLPTFHCCTSLFPPVHRHLLPTTIPLLYITG